MKKLAILLLVLAMAVSLIACGGNSGTTPTGSTPAISIATVGSEQNPTESVPDELDVLEQIAALFASLENIQIDGLNAYAASYEKMVAYLTDCGVIAADAVPVDMNTTAGYVMKYDETRDEAIAFADEAWDYNGVYLIHFDLSADGIYGSNYTGMTHNDGIIPIAGGMYTVKTAGYNGCFALGFSPDCDASVQSAALDALASLDASKPSLDYYNMSDLAIAMQKAGIISVQDLANAANVNEDYSYVTRDYEWVGYYDAETNPEGTEDGYSLDERDITTFVQVASDGYHYEKFTVYFFDNNDGDFVYFAPYYTYEDLVNNAAQDGSSTAALYYDPDGDWVYEAYPDASLSVDMIFGNFAVTLAR